MKFAYRLAAGKFHVRATPGTLSQFVGFVLLAFAIPSGTSQVARSAPADEARDHAMRGVSLAKSGHLPDAEVELQQAVHMAPGVAQYRAQLASILGLQGKWKPALVSFQRAVDLAPENLDFRRESAAVQWQLGLLDAAEKNLQYVLIRRPQDSGSILLLGLVKEKSGDYAKAVELLDSVFERVSSQPDRLVAMFHAVVESRHPEKTAKVADVLRSHSGDKQWANAISRCTQLASQAGDLETASSLFALLPVDDPARPSAALHLAKLQHERSQIAEAKLLLLQLEQQGVISADLQGLLGNCYESERQPALALQAYQQAIQADTTRVDYYEDLISLLLYLQRPEEALHRAEQAIVAAPNDARPWVWKGNVELRRNSPQEAMQSYKHAVRLDHKNPDALIGVATVYFATGQSAEAIAEYKAGISRFPDDARFYVACAEMLVNAPEASTQQEEARRLLEKAVQLMPQSSEAHYLLGQLAMKRGRLQAAESEFQISLQSDPDRSKTHFALSRVYRKMGRSNDAQKEFALYENLKRAEEGEGNSSSKLPGPQ